jgi:hypothetical protein
METHTLSLYTQVQEKLLTAKVMSFAVKEVNHALINGLRITLLINTLIAKLPLLWTSGSIQIMEQ